MSSCHDACGCEVARCCLQCPRAVCKYDDPALFHGGRQKTRRRQVWEKFHIEGATLRAVAREFHLSERQIQRLLAEQDELGKRGLRHTDRSRGTA